MGYITLICLGITILALVLGALFGLLRGLNRSLLRLIIVAISVVGAILLRNVITDIILGIKIDGKPIGDHIASLFATGDAALPQSLQAIVFTLIEIVFGFASYLVLFYLLRFLSWIIIFPICKIFVKRGEKKRRWWGALVGLVQGFLVAFCTLSPVTGLLVQVDEVSKLKVDGVPLFVVSEEVGLTEYHESFLGKTYITIGDWYFNLMATGETADGTVVNIHDTVDIAKMALSLLETVPDLSTNIDVLKNEDSSFHEKAESLTQVGDTLIDIGNNLDSLSPEAKEIIDSVISDVVASIPSDEMPEEVSGLLENFSLEEVNLVGVGESIKGISSFIDNVEINNTPENVTQEDIDLIVHGLSLNPTMTNTLGSMTDTGLIDVTEMGFGDEFMTAINNVDDAETKENLMKIFGLDPSLLP